MLEIEWFLQGKTRRCSLPVSIVQHNIGIILFPGEGWFQFLGDASDIVVER
jgi:hypothetical protein